MRVNLKTFLVAASIGLFPSLVSAATVRWELSGVQFVDGGTASGWFEFDADADEIGRYAIFTTAGTSAVGAHVYTLTTGYAGRGNPVEAPAEQNTFFNTADRYDLRLTPTVELDNAGGVRDLDIAAHNDNLECDNCGTYRFISAGQLLGVTDDIFGDGFD
jgi:hypothetical protein